MNKYLIYDTETKSSNPEAVDVNIHDHSPFMVTYVVADEKLDNVYQDFFFFDDPNSITKKITFDKYLNECPTIVGANIKYDVHMLMNKGYDKSIFENKNYIDVQVLARLCIDGDKQTDKNFSVALKKLATLYLGIDSNAEERALKHELSLLNQQHKQRYKQYMIDNGIIDDTWNKFMVSEFLKDTYDNWYDNYHLYMNIKKLRKQFFINDPRPSYDMCSNVRTYAMTDAVLTWKLLKLWYPLAIRKKQSDVLVRTSAATFPLVMMERNGLSIDINKVARDREILLREFNKEDIIDPRNGNIVSVGQHKVLKEIYEYESGMKLSSADKTARSHIEDKSPTARLVSYKQQISKYLQSYVNRVLRKLSYDNGEYKIYTQYKMSGTVTGRLSSDFQQFPKEPLELETGEVINIRSWFPVPKDYDYMFYFDYSQLELRLQCEWTSIISANGLPDTNMTRAFMPYKCILKDGKYYLEEAPDTEWKPTDMHALTAKNAFPGIDETHPEWSHYRKLGKRANFACNYGAAAPKLVESLEVDFPTAKRLVDGYKQSYKGVVDFGKWIKKRSYTINEFPNLFKRYYYSTNAHELQNWLVQGSGADLLLIKLKETYEYLKTHPWWSYVITVHDEIGFACKNIPLDQLHREVKEIQVLMKQSLGAVDIISDVEYVTEDWGHKKDYTEEEFDGDYKGN